MENVNQLEDFKIPVKFKLSALWISVMFCYIYCDFFMLYVPGHIQDLNNGDSGVGATTPVKLLLFAIMMSIPSIMVFLSLSLKPTISRWVNISTGMFFTLIMLLIVSTSYSEWKLFYTYFGTVEIILTSSIVFISWKWPKVKLGHEK